MSLINLVMNSKLQIEENGDNDENLVIAKYIVNEKILSKYIIVAANQMLIEKISSDDELKKIEERYLEKIFFDIEGDLSWNLYLVFVLKSEEYEKLNLKHKNIIERNDRFARKIIVNETDFNKYVPVGQIINNNSSKIFADPVIEWNSELEKHNLQFCLYAYNKTQIANYLIGEVDNNSNTNDQIEIKDNSFNNNNITINYLKIGKGFREYCFIPDTKLLFGTVNLLSGSNGCGKTSILEAIELTITGEIKKSLQHKSDLYERDKNSDCQLGFGNGEIVKVPRTAKEMKNRESYYYQNREKRISKLNRAFHQYNYYSYEDTFEFCYLDEQPDYNDEFSKIIFGEGSKNLEKNIIKHKEEFGTKLKSIEKEIELLKRQQDAINEIAISIDMNFNLEPIYVLLDKISMKYEKMPINTRYEDIKDWLIKQNVILKSLKTEISNITKRINADSKNQIQEIYTSKLYEEKSLRDKLGSLGKDIKTYYSNKQNLIETITSLENSKKSLDALNEKLNEEKKVFNKYALIYKNVKKANTVLDLYKQLNIEKEILKKLEYINNQWKEIAAEGTIKSFNLLDIEDKISEIKLNVRNNSSELEQLKKDIKIEETKKTTISKIITQIKVLGNQYIQERPESKVCPLCGKEYNSTEEFISNLENDVFYDESGYKMLLEKRDNIILSIEFDEKEIKDLELQKNHLNNLQKANLYISENLITGCKFNVEEMQYREMYIKLLDVIKTLSVEHLTVENLQDKLYHLELEGINYNSVYNALKFINDKLNSNSNYLDESHIKTIEKYYDEEFSSITNKLLQINNELMKEREKVEIVQREIKIKNDVIRSSEETLMDISKEKSNIQILLKDIDSIESMGILTQWNLQYSKLVGYIEDILKEIESSIVIIDKNIRYTLKKKQFDYLENQISKNNKMKERCLNAIKELSALKPLDKYCDEFIRDNINDISELFTSLHSPREFERLALDENGKIVGYRIKKNNDEFPIPIFMMSTGQRSAVVLSIFIRLHIIMKSAPNFILLDEPVANIDDLNILALLDFLKEMCTSNKTQIFFTTANEGVSRLFKRKFSFLEDKFCEFEFTRYGNENTIINRKIHNNHNDEVINSFI